MSSTIRDPEAVAVFVEESTEALQRLETLLLEAERGKPRQDMLQKIFRDVHSLKGNAGYLGYELSHRVAHAAEDLLSTLHDSDTVSASQCTVLLAAGDQLRRLITNIRASSEEGAFDVSALLNDLRIAAGEAPAQNPQTTASATDNDDALPALTDSNDGTVRIHLNVLDRLMNLTGELVLAGNQMAQVARNGTGSAHTQAVSQRLSLAIAQMQDQVMKTRMQPISRAFDKLPRMVRDLEKTLGKQVQLRLEGISTELDRAVIDAIRDPLMHIVRNAVDHGIEAAPERSARNKPTQGLLKVSAMHSEGMVLIEVQDDGRGMDPALLREHAVRKELITPMEAKRLTDQEAVQLVFRPGFSTAQRVTDVSGRGVGMDVVRTQVESAGGHVEISTITGRGTCIRLKLPLTLAVIPAMLVRSTGHLFAIPQASIVELISTDIATLEHVRGALVYRLRGQLLPLVRLNALLGLGEASESAYLDKVNIVVMQALGQAFGVLVDAIDNMEDIVIKALDGAIKRLGVYAGAATLASGGVALVLDATGLATRAGLNAVQHRVENAASQPTTAATTPMLTFRAGQNTLCAVPLRLVARLEEVAVQRIEHVANGETLQYRGSLLPIVRPENLLPLGEPQTGAEQPIIVLDAEGLVGIAVTEILDVVDAPAQVEQTTAPLPYVIEQRVLGNRTALVLDAVKIAHHVGRGGAS